VFINFWHARWDISSSHLFLQTTTTNHFEEDMASKNAVVQSSKKAIRSTSQGSTAVNAASGGVITRSMAKATARSATKQAVVTATSQSCKKINGDSKIANEVSKIASYPLKQKSVAGSNMPQTIPCRMDELQIHTNTTFQPIDLEDDGYSSSNSSAATPKESPASYAELNLPTLSSCQSW